VCGVVVGTQIVIVVVVVGIAIDHEISMVIGM
jgi:hypothetical protein